MGSADGNRGNDRSRLRVLLASSSVAALLVAGASPPSALATPLCYTGPFPFTNNGQVFCITVSGTSFAGNLVNSGTGTISPGGSGGTGINVTNASTITGHISNAGAISVGGAGILIQSNSVVTDGIRNSGTISTINDGIRIDTVSSFAGDVYNSGTIAAGGHGIVLSNISTFTDFITTTGTISAGGSAIVVDAVSIFGTPVSNLGGIVNKGTIVSTSNTAVRVVNVSNFSGGIINNGTISAHDNGVYLDNVSSRFGGGITNNGVITATMEGMEAYDFAGKFIAGWTNNGTISAGTGIGLQGPNLLLFLGGVTNNGTIAATNAGIVLSAAKTFFGGVTNTGTIAAGGNGIVAGGKVTSGASITMPRFSGGITNSGNISVGGYGILLGSEPGTGASIRISSFSGGISNDGVITARATAILVNAVSTFVGGITNDGTITGLVGIAVSNSGAVSVFDSGTIIGADGTAVDLSHHRGNTFGLGPGFAITGNVLGSGNDVFQLGGTGIGTFNLSTIGAGRQYRGFTTFDVVGATWIATGTGNESWTIENGTLQLGNGGTSGAINGHVTDNGTFAIDRSDTYAFGGNISGSGSFVQMGPGTTVLTANNRYTGATDVNAGTLQAGATNAFAPVSDFTVASGAVLALNNFNQTIGSLSGAGGVTLGSATLTTGGDNASTTFSGVIGGSGGFAKTGGGSFTLTGANSYSAGTTLSGGTLVVGNDSALGTGTLAMAAGTTLSFLNTGNFTVANKITISGDPNFTPPSGTTQTITGVIADGSSPGTLAMSGAGTLVLSAINSYSGPTNVTSGTLDVTGSIASSSLTTVASGATLNGTGTIGSLLIGSGATFAPGTGTPGTSATVTGNLAFASGAIYLVQLSPSSATSANVGGTAALTGATVNAQFAPGSYVVSKQYTILTAAAGLGGTSFTGLSNSGLPSGASDTLSYDPDHVYLNLKPGFTQYSGLTANQQNVANALTEYFNSTGGIPAAFFGLSANALTQLDGEDANGAERAAFQLTDQFLNLMLDPFVDGRLGGGGAGGIGATGGQAMGFAPDQQASLPPDVALAYAAILTKAPSPAPFAQRWTAWGAAYGGSSTASGDPAAGSSNVTAQTYGFAGGMDYHYSPDSIFGFALAGGGTGWNLSTGGTGRSDAFQAGVYGITRSGPAYLAAALAFTNHWFTTNRTALGDQLTANFDGQSYGARLEGGYRFAVLPTFGVTPYAALQAQDFHTPGYTESDLNGGGFGLSYAAMNATDVRTELGGRLDSPQVIAGMPLILRGRVAWAHDFVTDPSLSAAFQSLPGASFIVNGAPFPHDSALTSAGAELFITPRLTLLAKFDGEFAVASQTYAGSGTLRYSW